MTGIQIDELNSTVLPSEDHEFAAMKDGLTVKLTIGQVVNLAKAAIVGGAPEALDTLNEIATALNDDANAVNAILSSISNVDNTADLNKPVSLPQQNALDGKQTTDDLVFVSGRVTNLNSYTIPLPAGFTEAQCTFLWASSGTDNSGYDRAYGYTGASRSAFCHSGAAYYRSISYLVIGRK
jgi:hypothetical protein